MIALRFHQLANTLYPIQTPIKLVGVIALCIFAVLILSSKVNEAELLVCAIVLLWSMVLNLIISGFRHIPAHVSLGNNANHQHESLQSSASANDKQPPNGLKEWIKNKLWRFYLLLLTLITLVLLGATLFLSIRMVNFAT